MRRQATHWTIAMQRAVGVSIVVAIALVAFTWYTQRSTQADLRIAVEELRARAAELALVARAIEQRSLAPTDVRVLTLQLRDKASDIAAELAKIQRDAGTAEAARATDIARDVKASAERLAQQPATDAGPLLQHIASTVQPLLSLEQNLRLR